MTRFLPALIVVATLLAIPANAQNLNRGYLAYNKGDYTAALREWRPLAERGSTLAQYNLGRMYFAGQGVDQDYAEARKWFGLAAAQEYAPAQNRLGNLYEKGLGVSADHREAVNWFRHAAEQGYTPAQLSLGLEYADGHGVAKDLTKAVMWFNIAAESGDEAASKYRDALIGVMTPDEIAEARRRAQLWLLKNRR